VLFLHFFPPHRAVLKKIGKLSQMQSTKPMMLCIVIFISAMNFLSLSQASFIHLTHPSSRGAYAGFLNQSPCGAPRAPRNVSAFNISNYIIV